MNYPRLSALSEEDILGDLDYLVTLAKAQAQAQGLMTDRSGGEAGYTLCLLYAATGSETNPPSVALCSHGGYQKRLHSNTCPPRYLFFFQRWAAIVPDIKSLSLHQKRELERAICGPLAVDSYPRSHPSSLFHPPSQCSTSPTICRIADVLVELARDIQNCRTSNAQHLRQLHNLNFRDTTLQPSLWPTPAYNAQTTQYRSPSPALQHLNVQTQYDSFLPDHQSTSPIHLLANSSPFDNPAARHPPLAGRMLSQNSTHSPDPTSEQGRLAGGFRTPTSYPGGFRSPTPHNSLVTMPSAQPYVVSSPAQAPQQRPLLVLPSNSAWRAPSTLIRQEPSDAGFSTVDQHPLPFPLPTSVRRTSLAPIFQELPDPSLGAVSQSILPVPLPNTTRRVSPVPNLNVWRLEDTNVAPQHYTAKVHRQTASTETATSIETTLSTETDESAGTSMSAETSTSTKPVMLDEPTTLFETIASGSNGSIGPINASRPTEEDTLDQVTARLADTMLATIITSSECTTPTGYTTPAIAIASTNATAPDEDTAFAKTSTKAIGVDTPVSEIIDQLCIHGCKNLNNELERSSISSGSVGGGGFGQVYHGRLKDGTSVALKILGVDEENESKHLKHAARELHAWSKCKHTNVAPLLGLAEFNGRIAMISRWMDHGCLRSYLKKNTLVDRFGLSSQIASGLEYLHSINIIHGDLKGPNVLVSNDGTPVLIDFGNAVLLEYTLQFTQTTTKEDMSIRWTAPELMNEQKPSCKSDVYALGMTILEIFTGKAPYSGMRDSAVMSSVGIWKRIPDRPTEQIPQDQPWGNMLWDLLMQCWDYVPYQRPTASDVCGHLRKITEEYSRDH